MIFLGNTGSARVCTSVLETDATNEVPAIPQLPHSHPLIVTDVSKWSDDLAAFEGAEYVVRPLGRIRVEQGGTFRIVCAATPRIKYPVTITEASFDYLVIENTTGPDLMNQILLTAHHQVSRAQ